MSKKTFKENIEKQKALLDLAVEKVEEGNRNRAFEIINEVTETLPSIIFTL